jgi:hypothetical protein
MSTGLSTAKRFSMSSVFASQLPISLVLSP